MDKQQLTKHLRNMFDLVDTPTGLWVEFFESGIDPIIESHQADLYCFFCGEDQVSPNENKHKPDCIYVRAKGLIDGLSPDNQ